MSQLGFGNANRDSRKIIKLTVKKLKSAPVFELREKVDGTWTAVQEESELSGYLENVKFATYKHGNGETKQISMYMDLGEFKAIVSTNLNSLGKGILNRFSNYSDLKGSLIKFRLYLNKAGYPAISVYMNGDNMEWGVTAEEMKANFNEESFWESLYENKILPQFNNAAVDGKTQKDLDDFVTSNSEEIPF